MRLVMLWVSLKVASLLIGTNIPGCVLSKMPPWFVILRRFLRAFTTVTVALAWSRYSTSGGKVWQNAHSAPEEARRTLSSTKAPLSATDDSEPSVSFVCLK
ncbi:hypothetical protein IAD21_05448 [Abditibacteriota bacterium]|nr:hypothetical protein IAD21_00152 [Abditibacteriota bacterium]BCM93557.1 hypothetical protein IAD21_05448 [Abditibacteriota bacterium]